MIERLILVGLINSTEFIQQIYNTWDPALIGSRSLKQIAVWCIDFYEKYDRAPERNIEDLYYDMKESGEIPSNMVKSIGEDLEDLAVEYDESFNVKYALDQANKHFKTMRLENHLERLEDILENEGPDAAEKFASEYKNETTELVNDLDLASEEAQERLEQAFASKADPLIQYPGPLGKILNNQLSRGSFVALLASEKRGKSFWLMDMAMRAASNRYKVAFIQAGDMTESQQLLRIGSYLTKLPTNEAYTGDIFYPEKDCLRNQLDLCDKQERRSIFGVWAGEFDEYNIRKEINKEAIIEVYPDVEDTYRTCTHCSDFHNHQLGVPWLEPMHISHAVTVDDAKRAYDKFFQKKKRHFRISTHPNNTLTVSRIKGIINSWERNHNFVPDAVVIDYADLLIDEKVTEFRQAQNQIWKDLRALSQERNCLVLTATQADAKSYEKNILTMSNFSEDKRKFAHVTAMFGLNQDRYGREKKLGIMRINQIVIREGEFDSTMAVSVLQNLNTSHPFLDSFI